MRKTFLLLTLLTYLSSCQLNWNGDIDLGSDFYYLVEPAFNSIVIPVNPKEPYKSSIYIIKDIESVGFNKEYIIATSKSESGIKYWQIDKKTESKQLGYKENSVMELLNVTELDPKEFNQIKIMQKIELKTKTEYRKELNYE